MINEIKRKSIGRICALVVIGIFLLMTTVSVPADDIDDWTSGGDSWGQDEKLGSLDDNDVIFITGIGDNERMRITSGGNIGIGTDTTPDATLEIVDSGTTPFMISNGVDGDGDFMLMDTNGRLGIGTTTPDAKFDVEVSSGGAAEIGRSTNSATGDYAVAMGENADATERASTALGMDTRAWGPASIAMGSGTIASGDFSTAMGYATTASGDFSTAIGMGIVVEGEISVGIGLGGSPPVLSQDNTMAIMGGNVGIGVIDPAEKLEIDGNILFNTGADRSIYVETPSSDSDGYDLTVQSGNAYSIIMGGNVGGHLRLRGGDGDGDTGSHGGDVYIYGGAPDIEGSDGDVILAHTGSAARGMVGIGTNSPSATLDVAGNIKLQSKLQSSISGGLSLYNNGGAGIFIDDNSFVGLGTSSPLNLLELEREGSVKSNIDLLGITNKASAEDNDGTETSIRFRHWYWNFQTALPGGEADSGRITIGTENDWYHLGNRDSYMAFQTSLDGTVDERVRISSEGRVGIGTIDPDKLLHIGASGGTSGSIRFEASDGDVVDLGITTNDQFHITGGNVGIGTSSPSDTLSVGEKVLISDSTNPSNPPAGAVVIYFDGDDLKCKNSAGTVITLADF